MSGRTAEQIQADLEHTFKELRSTQDPAKRKTLLKKLRELIAEAENRTEPPASSESFRAGCAGASVVTSDQKASAASGTA